MYCVSNSSNLILSNFQGRWKGCSLSALLPRHRAELEPAVLPQVLVGVGGCEERLGGSSTRRARVNILALGCLAVSLKTRERGETELEQTHPSVWPSLLLIWNQLHLHLDIFLLIVILLNSTADTVSLPQQTWFQTHPFFFAVPFLLSKTNSATCM